MHFKTCPRCKQRKPIITSIPGAGGKYCAPCTLEVNSCNKHFSELSISETNGLQELDYFLDEWYRVSAG